LGMRLENRELHKAAGKDDVYVTHDQGSKRWTWPQDRRAARRLYRTGRAA